MTEYRLVNDTGLQALKALAREEPNLFTSPNPVKLQKRMIKRADTDEVWGEPLVLLADLSDLNMVDSGGPETDAQFVPIVRNSLRLPPSDGLNEYRWASINCFVIPKYVPVRWSTSNLAGESGDLSRYVESHWLRGSEVGARRANAIARLWWLGELASRTAEHSQLYDEDDILNAMANNVNLYHQLLSRPNLLSRSRLVAAVYEVFLDGDNEYLKTTKYANELLETLNLRAADVSLDFMDSTELREVVEESKPPKEP